MYYNEIVKYNGIPDILIITPLREKDIISDETLNSVKWRTSLTFDWISFASKSNPVVNCNRGLRRYLRVNKPPKYVMKLDNDITISPNWIDKMYETLETCEFYGHDNIAYTYTNFEFYGHISAKFGDQEFDPELLKKQNYISFNSLINYKKLMEIGGFIHIEGQDRLWDWALWCQFLKFGYIGELTKVNFPGFRAYASPNSISARSAENYYHNYNIVRNHFEL